MDHWKGKRVPEKHLLLLYWIRQSLWLCGSQQTVENSSRDGNARLPYLPPEKSVCRETRNGYNRTWNNRLDTNWEWCTSRLYIVTLLIYLICRVHHAKFQAGWSTSWNQDCWSEWVSEVAQSCPTLCDPVDCSLLGSSVHGIFRAIVLEWIAISFSRGSSQPRDRTWVSRIVDRRFTIWVTGEVPGRLLGEIPITSDMQMIPPLWQKVKRNWRASWWKWKRKVKKLA